MAYVCEISPTQQVYLDLQGTQTVVTTVSSSPGQQQQSSSSFSTGSWTSAPTVYRTSEGVAIKIETAEGEHFVKIQGNSMSLQSHVSFGEASQKIRLQQVSDMPESSAPMKPMEPMKMEPMKPMEPMKMGNMEMNSNPMEMRMGNMEMRMGSSSSTSSSTKQFCSQCGASIKPDDRFCSSCGHRLNS